MLKNYPIDFVRQAIEQTLLEQHRKNPNIFIGGENQVSLFSFYEQIVKDEEVNRYIERYRELTEQANRLGLIANGVIVAPENPTITNLFSSLIIPMTFTCSFRCMLKDRDIVLNTINNMIDELKGTKVDIAEFSNGKLFKVGTIGNKGLSAPRIINGDYIGQASGIEQVASRITEIVNKGVLNFVSSNGSYVYYYDSDGDAFRVAEKTTNGWVNVEDDGTKPNILFPPENDGIFDKYKLSLSFDSVRCDEPRTLNGNENVMISFGGSATLVNSSVKLGNDLIKVAMKRYKVVKATPTTFADSWTYLEPLEMPSGNNADTQANLLLSNSFKTNSHTDSISLSLQYSFIIDENIDLIKQLFKYARYGIQTYITPNIIYKVQEWWSAWGEIEKIEFDAKIVESIDIENTESDTLSLTLPLQIQGENN